MWDGFYGSNNNNNFFVWDQEAFTYGINEHLKELENINEREYAEVSC